MNSVPAKEARTHLSELVNRVAYGKERITLTRHGAEVVAMVPVEDAKLIEDLEDYLDLKRAREALDQAKEKGEVSWEKLKEGLTPVRPLSIEEARGWLKTGKTARELLDEAREPEKRREALLMKRKK